MSDVISYIKKYSDVTFKDKPINLVDNIILCVIAYMDLTNIVASSKNPLKLVTLSSVLNIVKEDRNTYKNVFNQKLIKVAMPLLIESKRYGNILLSSFEQIVDEEKEMQLAALTFKLDDGSVFIAFRGTDMSFVGWVDNMNLMFNCNCSSQIYARKYLEIIAEHFDGDIHISGHSKGGNLAIYASSMCDDDIRDRIVKIYDNDSPGFQVDFFELQGYKKIEDKIDKIMPKSSVIGTLLCSRAKYRIVDSKSKWILQHDPFLWKLEDDDFAYSKEENPYYNISNIAINKWIKSVSEEEQKNLSSTFLNILKASGVDYFDFILDDWKHSIKDMLICFKNLEWKYKKTLLKVVIRFVNISTEVFFYYPIRQNTLIFLYQLTGQNVNVILSNKKNKMLTFVSSVATKNKKSKQYNK